MFSICIYLTDLKQLLFAAEVSTTETRKKCPLAFCLSELRQPRMNKGIQGGKIWREFLQFRNDLGSSERTCFTPKDLKF